MLKKVKQKVAGLLSLASRNQLALQSIIFWVAALTHITKDKFWFFAIPAIIFGGLQSILDQLRINNNN